MDRGAWWATVHGVTKSWTRLSDFHFIALIFEVQQRLFNCVWDWGRVRCLFVTKITKFHTINAIVGNGSPNSRLLGNRKGVKLRIKGCLQLSCTTLLVLEMKWFNSIPPQNDVKIKLMGEQMETAVFYCNTDSLHILPLIYNENGNCKWQAEGSL